MPDREAARSIQDAPREKAPVATSPRRVPQRSGCVLRNCTPGPGHPSGRYQADMREAPVFARTFPPTACRSSTATVRCCCGRSDVLPLGPVAVPAPLPPFHATPLLDRPRALLPGRADGPPGATAWRQAPPQRGTMARPDQAGAATTDPLRPPRRLMPAVPPPPTRVAPSACYREGAFCHPRSPRSSCRLPFPSSP